jgi:hypothetical protein
MIYFGGQLKNDVLANDTGPSQQMQKRDDRIAHGKSCHFAKSKKSFGFGDSPCTHLNLRDAAAILSASAHARSVAAEVTVSMPRTP